jgi:hypothetical protein
MTRYLGLKAVLVPLLVCIDEFEEVAHRGEHALANVISAIIRDSSTERLKCNTWENSRTLAGRHRCLLAPIP